MPDLHCPSCGCLTCRCEDEIDVQELFSNTTNSLNTMRTSEHITTDLVAIRCTTGRGEPACVIIPGYGEIRVPEPQRDGYQRSNDWSEGFAAALKIVREIARDCPRRSPPVECRR